MPELSRFYGIVIAMYYNDHEPAHFHVRYAGRTARFAIDTLELLDGPMPSRVVALVLEWASLHREQLRANWNLRKRRAPLLPIPPLE